MDEPIKQTLSEHVSSFLESLSMRPELSWLHLSADLMIGLAYLIMAGSVFYFVKKRRDLKHRSIFYSFALFCVLGSSIHFIDIGAPWYRLYGIQAYAKFFAAFFSLFAIFFLFRSIPKAMKLPNPRDVRESEEKLNLEIFNHRRSEESLKSLARELESKIQQNNQEISEIKGSLELEIKQRQSVEAALQKNEKSFRALTENAFDMTLILNANRCIHYVSSSVYRLLGFKEDKLTGKSPLKWIHPEDLERIEAFLSRQTSTVGFQEMEFRIRHRDGSWKVLQAIVQDFVGDKTVQGILVNARDITEQRQTENKIRLLPEIMQEISRTEDSHSALEIAIRKICETTGWDYGEAWIPRVDQKFLESSPAWYGAEDLEPFRQLSRELRFVLGMGLPGRVWETQQPLWLEDLSSQSNASFTRGSLAEEGGGLRTALGVPVVANNRVSAILVFFRRQSYPMDARLVHLISSVTAQLGSVIRRRRAEEALREAHELLEKRIKERTKELEETNRAFELQITERAESEGALRRAQENYLKLVNSLDGIVWEYDLKPKKFTFVSDQAERVLGYPVRSWFEESFFWQEHIHGADREAAVAFRAKVVHERKDNQFEYRMISAEGEIVWLRDMITVVVDEDEVVKLRGVMVDVTERRQVEEALNQERNFASAVLDTAGALVIILESDGRVKNFNRACAEISGYPLSEVQNKYFWELFAADEEEDKIKATYKRLFAGQFPTNYESFWIAKDGTRRAIAWTSTVLLKKDGTVDHVITTGIDITKRQEIEQKLKEAVDNLARSNEELDISSKEVVKANERLQRLDELKSQFIFAASHELKTPLTSIKGFLETIIGGEAGELNAQQKEFLGYVKESTDRLHRLLNELLDISKIESGQIQMTLSLTRLRDLLKEEILFFKVHAKQKDISLKMEVDEHLKDIYCDSDKIKEVMANLLSNAIKYTPRGGKIKIHARNQGPEAVQIEVQDTGIGIKDADIHRIFEPFQHIEKQGMEDGDSTGLGLTLAKKIIEAHEGEIHVKSSEGKGAAFTVVLPHGYDNSRTEAHHWAVTAQT